VIRRAGRRTAAAVGEYGSLLSRRINNALLAVLGALWLSGGYWLLLHYLWARPGEFGVIRHPFEAPTLLVHGVIAMAALFLLGWFAGRHANAASSGRRVGSGWLLTLLTAALVIAGCAQLFLTSAAWQEALAVVHGWRASAASRVSRDRAHADGRSRGHAPPHGGRHPPRNARS